MQRAFDHEDLLKRITAIPHRGAGTPGEEAVLKLLEGECDQLGVRSKRETFRAPRTYIPMIWWLSGVMILGLIWPHWGTFLLAAVFLWGAFLYFDWRPSFLIGLPPSIRATNLWAKKGEGKKRLLLMAHHDSAPVAFAYRPSQVKNFRQSVISGFLIMAVATVVIGVGAMAGFMNIWLQSVLIVLLIIQGLIASIDFWRFGYTNAANDNGTGVAAVMATAQALWADMPKNWTVEVLFTGAEEAGMVGAKRWLDAHGDEIGDDLYVLNIDTVGAGTLHYVEKTGTFTTLDYDNQLVDIARDLSRSDARFKAVKNKAHRVADFDSVWFARAAIPALTLGSYDENGLMPHLHRPEDTIEHVDPNCVREAVEFSVAIARRLMA